MASGIPGQNRPGGPAAKAFQKPVGHQPHHRYIGQRAANTGSSVQDSTSECPGEAYQYHGAATIKKPENNGAACAGACRNQCRPILRPPDSR